MSTKGWIKNDSNGKKMSFQYNPSSLDYSRGASYSDISAPGMSYPDTQYTKGNVRSFSVPLFLYDNPNTGIIKRFIEFFEAFLPPEDNSSNYTKPPTLTFCFGYFIRKCVLEDLSVSIVMMDAIGQPLQANITLKLRQV